LNAAGKVSAAGDKVGSAGTFHPNAFSTVGRLGADHVPYQRHRRDVRSS
jgi:hypothetical protein